MENSKNILALVGAGIGIGVVLTVIVIVVLGARPSSLNLGPVEFDFRTATAENSTTLPTAARPTAIPEQATRQPAPSAEPPAPPVTGSTQVDGPFREHRNTPTVGTGVLTQGTYSDGMAAFSESDVTSHLNIQRIRLEENPDGCGIAFLDADKIWFGSSVKTNLTINDTVVGGINGPTGKHGYIFLVLTFSVVLAIRMVFC